MPITGDHPWTVAVMNWETILEPGWTNLGTPTIDGYRCYAMSNRTTGQQVVHRLNWGTIVARVWDDTYDPAFTLTHWTTTLDVTRSFRHAPSIDDPAVPNLQIDTWEFDEDGQSVTPTREADLHLGRRWNEVTSFAVGADLYLITTSATGDDLEVLRYETTSQRLTPVQTPDLDRARGRCTNLHTTMIHDFGVAPEPTDPNPPSNKVLLLTMYRPNRSETATVRLQAPVTAADRSSIVDVSSLATTRTSSHWDHAVPFVTALDNGDPVTYLLLHRAEGYEPDGHNFETMRIREDGTATRVVTRRIEAGWNQMAIDVHAQLSLLNTDTGDAQRWTLDGSGKLDGHLDPMEPLDIDDVKHVWEREGDSFRDPTMLSYWRDMSVDNVNVSGVVTGWHTIPGSWEAFVAQDGDDRRATARAAIAAAGYAIPANHKLALLFAVSTFEADASIDGHRYNASLTFWQHETGHNLDLNHSYRRNLGYGREIEYGDRLDIMSAMKVITLGEDEGVTIGAPAGPGVNMAYRQMAGWIFPGDLIDLTGQAIGRQTHTINTLSELPDRTRVGPPYGLVFDAADGRRLLIEYRTDHGWDAGIQRAQPRILEIRNLGTRAFYSVVYTDGDRNPIQTIFDAVERPAISIKENDDGTSCTVTLDDRRANIFLFALNSFREPVPDGNRYLWTEGWDHAHFYQVGDRSFIFLMKSTGYGGDGHNIHVHAFDTASEIGARVYSTTWNQGWTSSEIVTSGDRTFLVALRTVGFDGDGHNVVMHEFLPNGALGPKVTGTRLANRAWHCVTAYGSPGTVYLITHGRGDPERDGFNTRMYRLDERDDYQFSGSIWDPTNLPDDITHLSALRRVYWVYDYSSGFGPWVPRTREEQVSLIAGSSRRQQGHIYHIAINDDQTFGGVTWDDPVNGDIPGYRALTLTPSNGTNTPDRSIARLHWLDWGDVANAPRLVTLAFTAEQLRSESARFIDWDGQETTLAHGVATDGSEALLALP